MLPSDLQETLSRNLDLPVALVSSYARRLREADLLSRGGRGSSAARMVLSDAANLLIAVAGSTAPSEAVEQLAAYARTQFFRATGNGVLRGLGLDEEGMSGSAAILRIMTAASNGVLDGVLGDAGIRPDHAASAFELTFVLTAPVGVQIRFSGYSGQSALEDVRYRAAQAMVPRMRTLRNVDGRALISLARALSP